MQLFGADHRAGELFEVHAAVVHDSKQFAVQRQRLLFMAPRFFQDVVNTVPMGFFNQANRLRRMTAETGEYLANLLGVQQRFRRLRGHERNQRDAIWAGYHQARMGVADDASEFGLEDLVEYRRRGVEVKVRDHKSILPQNQVNRDDWQRRP